MNTIFNSSGQPIFVMVYDVNRLLDEFLLEPDGSRDVPVLVAKPGGQGELGLHYKIGHQGNPPSTYMDVWIPFGEWSPRYKYANAANPWHSMVMRDGNQYQHPCRIYVEQGEKTHIVIGELDVGPAGEG